jgi:hypothetical protein
MSAKIVVKGYDANGKYEYSTTTSDKPETLERLMMDFCRPRVRAVAEKPEDKRDD